MKVEEFDKIIREKDDGSYGLCPPPLPAQEAIDILRKHFLDEDWYIAMPVGVEQANTEIVHAIISENQPNIIERFLNIL
jgi:hypothetical protein